MGKGRGDKSAFASFIDESFFAFWFRQWAAFFIITGVVLIIVGGVVYGVLPPAQYSSFAQQQLVLNKNSQNYNNWLTVSENVRYDFLNTDPATLQTTVMGPYFFLTTMTKSQVTFSADGTTVTYTTSGSKAFVVTGSNSPNDEITMVNPSYIDAVKVLLPSLLPFLSS